MNDKNILGLLAAEDYVSRRSATLISSPSSKLDERLELDSYISKLDLEHKEEIKRLSCADTQPLSKKVRVVVTIIAYGEGSGIRKTLDGYLNQDLPRDKFEIIILDNHPEHVKRDDTKNEVQSFKETNPDISVVYSYKVWKTGEATVGNARKHVFDIALLRIHERDELAEDTILISNDADILRFEKNYLSSILYEFDSNNLLDALGTPAVVPPEVFRKPNMYAILSFWDILDEVMSEGEPAGINGISSSFRVSIYCAVGGYNPKATQVEDLELGWLIADAREWSPKSIIRFNETKCIQNPRRILTAVSRNVPITEMFVDFESSPEIRNADNEVLLKQIPENLDFERLEDDIGAFWHWRNVGRYQWNSRKFEEGFNRALETIGVEYELVGDNVCLKNVEVLLKNYEKEFERKIGIVHSEPRELSKEREKEIITCFSAVPKSFLVVRKKMADKIADQIKRTSKSSPDLLKSFERFAGYEYRG